MMETRVVVVAALLLLAFWHVEATGKRRRHYKNTYYKLPKGKIYHWKPADPWWVPDGRIPISVGAYFDMNHITGTIQLYQEREGKPVVIHITLNGLDQFDEKEMWGWHIHEYPLNWALLEAEPCGTSSVGDHYDPENLALAADYDQRCASDPNNCEVGDLSGRHGRLKPNQTTYTFTDSKLNLYGSYSPIGRSIVIHRTHGYRWSCANIEYDGHNSLHTFRAAFPHCPKEQNPAFQGEIIMRWSGHRAGVTLEPNLYRVDNECTPPENETEYRWGLWEGNVGECGDCSGLTHMFGSITYPPTNFPNCGQTSDDNENHQRECAKGDFAGKCGPLVSDGDCRIQAFCTDTQLGLYPYRYYKNLAVAIQDGDGNIVACSKFEPVIPRCATAFFYNYTRDHWIYSHLLFYQYDPHDPTYIRSYVVGLNAKAAYYRIRTHQVSDRRDKTRCISAGAVFEPRFSFEPLPIIRGLTQTGDRVYVGDLRYKLKDLRGEHRYRLQERNSYIPLFGDFNIIGRSIVLHDINGYVLGCANIEPCHPGYFTPDRSLEGYHKK